MPPRDGGGPRRHRSRRRALARSDVVGYKVPVTAMAARGVRALIERLRHDDLEMRVGYPQAIYQEILKRPDGALQFVNAYSA